MKTYQIARFGGPEGLQLTDRPEPVAGDREIIVRIRAASLNYRDLVVLRGEYARNPEPAAITSPAPSESGTRPGSELRAYSPRRTTRSR